MKIRYEGKLYNTINIKTKLEQKNQYGYWGDLESFTADDGEKICFKPSRFTNFEHVAYVDSWTGEDRYYSSKQLASGVVKIEYNISMAH